MSGVITGTNLDPKLETWIPNGDGTSRLSTISLAHVWGEMFRLWDGRVPTDIACEIASAVETVLWKAAED